MTSWHQKKNIQQEHFQEKKLPNGCMPESHLYECKMSKSYLETNNRNILREKIAVRMYARKTFARRTFIRKTFARRRFIKSEFSSGTDNSTVTVTTCQSDNYQHFKVAMKHHRSASIFIVLVGVCSIVVRNTWISSRDPWLESHWSLGIFSCQNE